jgi:hypothetical protein
VFVAAAESVLDPTEVDVIDWAPRWSFRGLSANFARVQILLTVFDGDPDKWLDSIERWGTEADEGDVPFLVAVKQRLSEDPSLLDDMRRIMREFAERFGAAAAY